MKKPYTAHMSLPNNQRRATADAKVQGLPRMDTEKSDTTRLNRITFKGVHNWSKWRQNLVIKNHKRIMNSRYHH